MTVFRLRTGTHSRGARLASLRLARSYPSIVYFVISPVNLLRSFPVSITRIQRTPPRFTWTAGGHAPASVSPLLRQVWALFFLAPGEFSAVFSPNLLISAFPARFRPFSRRICSFPRFRRVFGHFLAEFATRGLSRKAKPPGNIRCAKFPELLSPCTPKGLWGVPPRPPAFRSCFPARRDLGCFPAD